MSRRRRRGLGSATPLLRHHVGVETCERYGKNKLCVTGARYGFIGRYHSSKNEKDFLPVPTGEARTPQAALKNAKAFLDSVHGKNN